MAMRTASPFWLSLAFGAGLLLVFIGERLAPVPSFRVMMTVVGLAVVVIATLARAWAMSGSKGPRKRIERTLFACHAATCVALLLYAMTTSWAPSSLEGPKAEGALTVLWIAVMIASLVPVLMIEIALGTALRGKFDVGGDQKNAEEAGVDFYRVRDVAWSGLSMAFALGFLMVTCNVAKERNIQRDVSYFKTSMAGDSTQNIVKAGQEALQVHLFFPEANEAKEYVRSYFETLQSSTSNVEITTHDRLADAELAQKYGVSKDGVIVLVRGARKHETIEIPQDELKEPEKLRRGKTLRTLDSKVNKALLKLARDKRKAYVTAGHGEVNDPGSIPPDLKGKTGERRTTLFKQRLGDLNYEVKDLGAMTLAKDVPDDATVVIVMAPIIGLQDAEWQSIDRYLVKGGRVLIALDPKSFPGMGALEGRLGLKMNPAPITDDEKFLPQGRGSISDRRFAMTTQFTAHSSTTALSRSEKGGLPLIDAGSLDDIPFVDAVLPKKTVTIRSMESSWLDFNNNFKYDADSEKKQRYTVGVAIEGPKLEGGKDGFRALVYSDVDMFVDVTLRSGAQQVTLMLSGPLLDDSVKWLGGEEVFAGEVVNEEDTPIEHSKNEKAAWFFVTVLGVPILVLVFGLSGTSYARRRRRAADTKGGTR
jgi:hypothetical protein